MKNNRKNYLIKNIFIFGLSIMATKLITFLLVPIYTYCLTPNEFGITDLLFSIGGFLIPLATFNISEAIYRFSMDKESNTNKITSIIVTILIVALLELLLIIPAMSFFPNYAEYKIYYYFYIISSSISQVLSANLKGQEKLKHLSICNILFTLIAAVFCVLFLVVFKMKIEGYFAAFIISNIIVGIYAFIAGNIYQDLKKFELDKKLLKSMIKYSIVLVPTSFMWWIINASDRIIISKLISDFANGIYAVSYKIPSLFITILSIFTSAWVFSAIKEKDEGDNEKYSNNIFSKFYFVVILFAMFIFPFVKPFLKIYVAPNYYDSWIYVAPLLLGGIFLTLSNYLATFYTAQKDSKGLLYSATIGAVLNIILNIILISKINILGAAIATGISYFIVFLYRFFNVRKYIKIYFKYEYLLAFVFLSAEVALLYIKSEFDFIIQISLLIIFCILNLKQIILIIKELLSVLKLKFKKADRG